MSRDNGLILGLKFNPADGVHRQMCQPDGKNDSALKADYIDLMLADVHRQMGDFEKARSKTMMVLSVTGSGNEETASVLESCTRGSFPVLGVVMLLVNIRDRTSIGGNVTIKTPFISENMIQEWIGTRRNTIQWQLVRLEFLRLWVLVVFLWPW